MNPQNKTLTNPILKVKLIFEGERPSKDPVFMQVEHRFYSHMPPFNALSDFVDISNMISS